MSGKLKQKDIDLIKSSSKNPKLMKKLMDKIPYKLLIKFFIQYASFQQLEQLNSMYKRTNQTKKYELLNNLYRKKHRKDANFKEVPEYKKI